MTTSLDRDQLARIMDRARHKLAEQAGTVGVRDATAGASVDTDPDEMRELRSTLANEARARTLRAEANLSALRSAAVGAVLTYGAFAALGPVGFVVVALGGHAVLELWREEQ